MIPFAIIYYLIKLRLPKPVIVYILSLVGDLSFICSLIGIKYTIDHNKIMKNIKGPFKSILFDIFIDDFSRSVRNDYCYYHYRFDKLKSIKYTSKNLYFLCSSGGMPPIFDKFISEIDYQITSLYIIKNININILEKVKKLINEGKINLSNYIVDIITYLNDDKYIDFVKFAIDKCEVAFEDLLYHIGSKSNVKIIEYLMENCNFNPNILLIKISSCKYDYLFDKIYRISNGFINIMMIFSSLASKKIQRIKFLIDEFMFQKTGKSYNENNFYLGFNVPYINFSEINHPIEIKIQFGLVKFREFIKIKDNLIIDKYIDRYINHNNFYRCCKYNKSKFIHKFIDTGFDVEEKHIRRSIKYGKIETLLILINHYPHKIIRKVNTDYIYILEELEKRGYYFCTFN